MGCYRRYGRLGEIRQNIFQKEVASGLNPKGWMEVSQIIKGTWGYLIMGQPCERPQGDKSLLHAGNHKLFRTKRWSIGGQQRWACRDKQRGLIKKKCMYHPKGFGYYAVGNMEPFKYGREEIGWVRAAF